MITGIFNKFKTTYLGSIIDEIFSRKRVRYDDEDDDDERFGDLLEPSFKRPRFLNEEAAFSLVNPGPSGCQTQSERISPSHHISLSGLHTSPFGNITNLKTQLDLPSSSSLRRQNSSSTYAKTMAKAASPRDELSPIYASFKFSPSLSSTTARPKSTLGITKRRPIKSLPSLHMTPGIHSKFISERRGDGCIQRVGGSPIGVRKHPGRRGDHHYLKRFAAPPVTGIRKYLTPRESFRLQDREVYKRLLQQFTSYDVGSGSDPGSSLLALGKPSSSLSLTSRTPLTSSTSGILKSRLDPVSTSRSRQKLEKEEHLPTPSLSLPSAAKSLMRSPPAKAKEEPVPLIDISGGEEEAPKGDQDDDIIITKEVPAPPQPRKNPLEDRLQKSPFYSDSWLKDIREYYREKHVRAADDAASVTASLGRCEDRRRQDERRLMDRVADRISLLDLSFPKRVPQPPAEGEALPDITPEMEVVIERALRGGPPGQVLADKFNIQITRRDLHTLQGLNWLNDEVINFYLNLIVERGQNDNFPSVYAFNTFFYSKLLKTGYASVRRWTKKVDIFSHDLLLVPVHLGMHWCLATVDLRAKAIRYYDSMLGDNHKCLEELRKYLLSEHLEKKKTSFTTSLTLENVKRIPQQMNGSDCGMFSCKFAEYLSRDAPITFDQELMPYFRRRMVFEIVARRLL